MYCIQCGVKLADSEEKCPLCGLEVCRPQLPPRTGEKSYPPFQKKKVSRFGTVALLTLLLTLPAVVTLLCNLVINGAVTWSGYVVGALLLLYVTAVLPLWFKKPNPVVLVPCDFAAVALYLLYICLYTGGKWFLPFALPVTGLMALGVTALVVLCRYLRRGHLYIFGGAAVYFGLALLLTEFLLNRSFGFTWGLVWCWYPMAALVLLGIWLLVLAISRPLRSRMHRRFFI